MPKKKQQKETSAAFAHGMLRLKLGTCLWPVNTRKMEELLLWVAQECRRAKTVASWSWFNWCQANLGLPPVEVISARTGEPLRNRAGEVVTTSPYAPDRHEKLMYDAACAEVGISSKIVSACVSELVKKLGASLPYDMRRMDQNGLETYWEAVLAFQRPLPDFKETRIPIGKQDTFLVYNGLWSQSCDGPEEGHKQLNRGKALTRFGRLFRHPAAASFPLLSKIEAERRGTVTDLGVRLRMKFQSRGNREVLQKVLSARSTKAEKRGQRQLRVAFAGKDMYLCYRPPTARRGRRDRQSGFWELQLGYEAPGQQLAIPEVDRSRVAVLRPCPATSKAVYAGMASGLYAPSYPLENRYAFVLEVPGQSKPYGIGDLRGYWERCTDLEARRQAIRRRTHKDVRLARGRGRKRVFRRLLPTSRAVRNSQRLFINYLFRDLGRALVKFRCGTLHYREPTLPVRDDTRIPFVTAGLNFDWSSLPGLLANKAALWGVDLFQHETKNALRRIPRISYAHWRQVLATVTDQASARNGGSLYYLRPDFAEVLAGGKKETA